MGDFAGIEIPDLPKRTAPGRNEPCTCGSGRKFKKCCGKPGVAVYDALGGPIRGDDGKNPAGYALIAADEPGVSVAELLAFLDGTHRYHRGVRAWFAVADPTTTENMRFESPDIAAEFGRRVYRGFPFLVVRLPDEQYLPALKANWSTRLYKEIPKWAE